MIGAGVFLVVVTVLWVLAFVSKRRFGALGLALAAGALLSLLWSGNLMGIVERTDLSFASVSAAGVASLILVLTPPALLLFSGPSYRSKYGRLIGATLFAVFAGALIAEPLSSTMVLDSGARSVFDLVVKYQVYIVTAGVAVALLDTFAIHTVAADSTRKSKH